MDYLISPTNSMSKVNNQTTTQKNAAANPSFNSYEILITHEPEDEFIKNPDNIPEDVIIKKPNEGLLKSITNFIYNIGEFYPLIRPIHSAEVVIKSWEDDKKENKEKILDYAA